MNATAVECAVCGGPAQVTTTFRHRDTEAFATRCGRCGHRDGRLVPGLSDPPAVVNGVRRKLNALLKPARRTAQ